MKTIVELIGRIQDGGAETIIKDYALLLDKNKYKVVVICDFARKDSSIYKTLKDNNIEIIELYGNYPYLGRAISRLFGRKPVSNIFKRIIKRISPDLIHVHLECLELLYHAKECLKNIKLIYTCHNLPETLIGKLAPKESEAAHYLVENNGLKFIALHEDMAKEIDEMFNVNDTKVIRNGIDFNKYKNVVETKEEIRKKLNISPDSFVVGSVGRLTYQKYPEFIVDVFNEVVKRRSDSVLLMVGNGKLENDIKERIHNYGLDDKFILLSNRGDMPQLYKAMDVFLFPSRYEGLGIVLIEAQITGIHCVVSDRIPKEAFQSNLITVLSLEDPLDKWADSCIEKQSNIQYYGDIDEYDMNKEIKELEEVYDNLLL